ncbi:MAG TPA: MarR family winged helix-turn-helix transcriptional regulator [Pseudonocardia sp.]|nr:MarR family winged helix-turn-helix transcriptional regulator [Pseudonocardia sp.]
MASREAHDPVERVERSRMSAAEASWALREVNRAAVEVDQVLARRMGLRPLDYAAMTHVMTGGEPIGPNQLSTRLGISTGSATELVDRLEGAGHLRRRRDEHDRRRVALQPTDATVGRILGELGPLFAALDDLAADFTSDERDAVVRYLRRAAQLLRSYDAP